MDDQPENQEIYRGRIVTLRLKHVRQPDGTTRLREIVEHAAGAAVVAVDADGSVILVRQYRPAVDAAVLELPAGLVDAGETPQACARRELEEETGFTAGHLEPLAQFYSSPGFCTEVLHVYVATDLRPCAVDHDGEEELEVVRLPLEAALEQVLHTELSDAKTVVGLLAYADRSRLTFLPAS
jgi:ADP-ribose pyrophosphatase